MYWRFILPSCNVERIRWRLETKQLVGEIWKGMDFFEVPDVIVPVPFPLIWRKHHQQCVPVVIITAERFLKSTFGQENAASVRRWIESQLPCVFSASHVKMVKRLSAGGVNSRQAPYWLRYQLGNSERAALDLAECMTIFFTSKMWPNQYLLEWQSF